MAEGESRPLLGHRSSPWSQRSGSAASSGRRTNPEFQRSPRNSTSDRPISPRNSTIDKSKSHEIKNRHLWQVRSALALILISVVLERLSFYGLAGNLVLFLNEDPYKWESFNAVSASFLFFGVSYIMSLMGGWLSDSFLGRFRVIVLAYAIYICGYAMLPFLAKENNYNRTSNESSLPSFCLMSNTKPSSNPVKEPCAWAVFSILVIIAIGSGILKANICPFGADQLVHTNQQTQFSFYNLFYWCVNLGSFLGLGALAYVEQQQSFYIGFVVCAVCLGCSAVAFTIGRCCYLCRPADGSVLTNIFKIFKSAWENKRQQKHLQHNWVTGPERSHTTSDRPDLADVKKLSFLDYAKLTKGGTFHDSLVEDVKKLGTILAVFAVLIPYWLVYFQMQTTFLVQGLHMKLDLNTTGRVQESNTHLNQSFPQVIATPNLVAAWFSLFDAIVVIILLPLFDRVIYPRMARAGHPFTFSKRIILGMLFAIASMLAAGVVEHFRLNAYYPYDDWCSSRYIQQQIGNTIYYAADMSIWWQIPQYALIGISEVFASVASLQFAVTFAPKSMKAVVTGLFYFISGIASFLGIAFVLVLASTNTWFQSGDSGNINCRSNCKDGNIVSPGSCHLDYYFFSLAGCEAVGLILFLIVSRIFHVNSSEYVLSPQIKTAAKSGSIQQ